MKALKIGIIALVLTLMAIFILTSNAASSSITYSVTVFNQDRTSCPGAQITIERIGYIGKTNSNGVITFKVPPGKYTISAHIHSPCWVIPNKEEWLPHGRNGYTRITCGSRPGNVGTIKMSGCYI